MDLINYRTFSLLSTPCHHKTGLQHDSRSQLNKQQNRLSEKEYLGHPKSTRKKKGQCLVGLCLLFNVNMKPQAESLFTLVPITGYIIFRFQQQQQQNTGHAKRLKIQSEETNQASEPDLSMTYILDLSDRNVI